jgi:hypothetical protein
MGGPEDKHARPPTDLCHPVIIGWKWMGKEIEAESDEIGWTDG